VVIKKRKDYSKIKPGTILIAKEAHPDLVISARKIKGIAIEEDNKLCHAAIVAREFGIPILMGMEGIVKEFKTGEKIALDLERKTAYKIK
jgi:pyruvate,water dikinase